MELFIDENARKNQSEGLRDIARALGKEEVLLELHEPFFAPERKSFFRKLFMLFDELHNKMFERKIIRISNAENEKLGGDA
jgi:hypothetical protein